MPATLTLPSPAAQDCSICPKTSLQMQLSTQKASEQEAKLSLIKQLEEQNRQLNLMNQPLQAYCPTPDSMKREQERIENQLITFEKSLYLQPDTAQLAADTKGKKSKNATVSARGRKTEAAKESKQKEVKIKAPKAQKSAPVRSVRRRR